MQESAPQKTWRYFYRSAQLKCPVCGISPLFCPVNQIRNVNDWFETLPGCPRCDYVYDQAPGYFLLALWMFDYGFAALFGIALLLTLMNSFQLSTTQLLLFTLIPTFLFAILTVRHAKSFYLAIDHYFFHNDGHSAKL